MIYRNCTPDDFENLLPLFRQLWPEMNPDFAKMNAVFIASLESSDQRLVCAEHDGALIAFCSLTIRNSLWQQGKIGHIDELIVDETCRGRGIGTELLHKTALIAHGLGCRCVELDSAHHRRKAHVFYERNGFENRALLFSRLL